MLSRYRVAGGLLRCPSSLLIYGTLLPISNALHQKTRYMDRSCDYRRRRQCGRAETGEVLERESEAEAGGDDG